MQQRFNIKPRPPVILIGNVVLNEWRRLNPGAQVTRLDANGVPHNGYPVCEHGIILKNVCVRCQDKSWAERIVATPPTQPEDVQRPYHWLFVSIVLSVALAMVVWAYNNKHATPDCEPKPQNEVQKLMKQRSDALRTTFVF